MINKDFIDNMLNCYSQIEGKYVTMDFGDKYVKIFNDFDNFRYNIILKKTRQTGLTTLMMLFSAYKLLTSENQTIIYTSHSKQQIKLFIGSLHGWLVNNNFKSDIVKVNTDSIVVGSNKIIGVLPKKHAVIGHNIDILLVDNAAYIINLLEFFSSIISSVKPTARLIIGSSPNGFEYFNSLWVNDNNFNKNTLHWSDTKRFDEKWVNDMRQNIDNLKYRAELEGEFIAKDAEKLKTISLRITNDLYHMMNQKLLGTNENISDYIRRLIILDVHHY
jgi:hypothetical protein